MGWIFSPIRLNVLVISIMGIITHSFEHHSKHGDEHHDVSSIVVQMHSRQARPQPTGTTAASLLAKVVASGVPGHGVDWYSTITSAPPDHRNFEIFVAGMLSITLLGMSLNKLLY